MFSLNHLTFILIFTTVVSGSQNGERYNASSEAESHPGKQPASHINETTIDETARTNITVLEYNASSEAESHPGKQPASHINETTIDETARTNITVLEYNASSEAESHPGKQPASHINETTIDETARTNITEEVNKTNNETHATESTRIGQNPELASNETGIKFPPTFKHPSKMYNMAVKPAGSSIRLKCAADGNPTPNITWSKNNAPIARAYSQPSYSKWSMWLEELMKSDDGNYTCLICNELGCINHTVNLLVQERLYSKPVLIRSVLNQTKIVGETVHFSCQFLSDMHPLIFWKRLIKDEYVNHSNVNTNLTNNSMMITSEDPNDGPDVLTIFNVTKEHEGWYICVAMNVLGITSTQGYLTVLDYRYPSRPFVKDGYPGNKTAFINGTVRLTCPILSDLEYFSYWLKPAKNYNGIGYVGARGSIPQGLVLQSDDDTDKPEVLTLYNVTKEKQGWYVCVALNTLGRASAKGYLTVLDRNNQNNRA